MFTKIWLQVDGSSMEITGQFALDDSTLSLIRQWYGALPHAGDQARIDALVVKLRANNDALLASTTAQQGITSKE